MSQSGYTPIQLYRTTTASATPSAGNLSAGELAINLTDEKLYFKNAGGTVKVLASTGAGNAGGSNTQVQYNSSGVLTGSSSFVFDGTNVGIGTSSPGATLSVVISTTAHNGMRVTNNSTTQFAGSGLQMLGPSAAGTQGGAAVYYYNTTVGGTAGAFGIAQLDYTGSFQRNLAYYDYTGQNWGFLTNGSERMRIDSSGNVGIGTTSPGVKFQIEQNQAAYSYFDYYNVTNAGGVVWRQIVRNIANSGTTSVDLAKLIGGGFSINNNDTDATNFTSFGVGGAERFRITSTGGITSSDVADAVGYKGLPQNARGSSYTLALSDMGKHVYMTAAITVTVPPNGTVAFPIGTAISIVNASGSSGTIAQGSGVSLLYAGVGGTGNRTLANPGVATIVKVDTNTWIISGAGVS